tara:strand:- start:607 stop:1137 length:531 start_codon:yes stop_codon:yes gene_type:complete
MSKEKTNDQLIQERVELEKKAETLQVEAAERKFEINFSDQRMIKTVMEHLDKHYTWKTADAAVLVTLYENIKKQNKAYTTSNETPEVYAIGLRGHELNALYQALLNVTGTGVANAKKFITMLTHVGETVSTAMQDLASVNTEINDVHTRLAELDAEIVTEQIEAELEDKETVEAGN